MLEIINNTKNFDIRLADTDATSYHSCDVLQSAESEKKKSIYKIIELLLPPFVFLLMAYWEKKQIFYLSTSYVIFCVISGRDLSA